MTSDDETRDALNKVIVDRVNMHWSDHSTALLLAALGTNLRDFRHLIPNGLHSFLLEHPIVQIVRHPDMSIKVGAVPLGTVMPPDIRSLFNSSQKTSRNRSLAQDFWNAFHLPLEGRRRFVIITPSGFEIQNLPSGTPSGTHYEIDQDDLASVDGPAPVTDLVSKKWQKINAWLDRNKLDARTFASASYSPRPPDSTPRVLSNIEVGVFSHLEQQDQARILIPLDIVAKLIGKK